MKMKWFVLFMFYISNVTKQGYNVDNVTNDDSENLQLARDQNFYL